MTSFTLLPSHTGRCSHWSDKQKLWCKWYHLTLRFPCISQLVSRPFCDKKSLFCIVFFAALTPKNSILLNDQRIDCWWTVITKYILSFCQSQSLWPIDSKVLFSIHILYNWWIICQLSPESPLTNGLAVCETLVPLSLFAIHMSFCIVSYHNVIPEQILPYKEVHSPFISPQGHGCESFSLCFILSRHVYHRICKQGCITVHNNLCLFD